MASRGRGAHVKGSNQERVIAKLLSKYSGQKVNRTMLSSAGASMGDADIRLTGDIFFPVGSDNIFSYEVKNHKDFKVSDVFKNTKILAEFWEQAVTDCRRVQNLKFCPMLITHVDRDTDYCLVVYNAEFVAEIQQHPKMQFSIQPTHFVNLQDQTEYFLTVLFKLKDLMEYIPYKRLIKIYTGFAWDQQTQIVGHSKQLKKQSADETAQAALNSLKGLK